MNEMAYSLGISAPELLALVQGAKPGGAALAAWTVQLVRDRHGTNLVVIHNGGRTSFPARNGLFNRADLHSIVCALPNAWQHAARQAIGLNFAVETPVSAMNAAATSATQPVIVRRKAAVKPSPTMRDELADLIKTQPGFTPGQPTATNVLGLSEASQHVLMSINAALKPDFLTLDKDELLWRIKTRCQRQTFNLQDFLRLILDPQRAYQRTSHGFSSALEPHVALRIFCQAFDKRPDDIIPHNALFRGYVPIVARRLQVPKRGRPGARPAPRRTVYGLVT
jgi:hypothetical protein